MAGLTPLPQTELHSSTRLTHREAHSLLSSFLDRAQTNPAYRPDAHVTSHGLESTSSGDRSNLTLHHLDRILKGIAGQRLGGIVWNSGDGYRAQKRRRVDVERSNQQGSVRDESDMVDVNEADGQLEPALGGQEVDGWQDKEDYEHAQVNETAGLDGRDPAGGGFERHPEEVGVEVEIDATQALSRADKEARKAAKKKRKQTEKRERLQKRAQGEQEGEEQRKKEEKKQKRSKSKG